MQRKRQKDILVHFWCKNPLKVVTTCLTSFFLGRATAADIVQKIMAYEEKSKLPFERLFSISCYGPTISTAIWNRLNATLAKMSHQGLISL